MFKHLRSLHFLSRDDIKTILETARDIKQKPVEYAHALEGKNLAMFFELPSLRTRNSFEAAMTQLGGHAIFIKCPPKEAFPEKFRELAGFISETWLGAIESIKDKAKVLSRYVDVKTCRAYKDETLEALIEYSDVPVIDAMTPSFHPCQGLTDLFTIMEKKGKFKGLKLAIVGDLGAQQDGANVANSLMIGCAKVGIDVTASCPEMNKFMPSGKPWKWALEDAKEAGTKIEIEHDPQKAVEDADVIYAYYQYSFQAGPEATRERMVMFPPYQVNTKLVERAKSDVIIMHCQPAYRGLEITDAVIDGPHSVVYDQAENRLHTQKAILVLLTKKQ
ncbi:MAG: ornithine carbamoyltransferase [Candidatus Bathyarchaeota archaeon]|nr:MAG: ornithine carbamoyltransferase [Candidatus Bathyarchaeota archaeon]